MIMGRKTFDSFPAPLPGRRHIVLTREPGWRAEGTETAAAVESAIALAGEVPAISVLGRAEIFALFLPPATRLDMTEVQVDAGGDTVLPPFSHPPRSEARREGQGGVRTGYTRVTPSRPQ